MKDTSEESSAKLDHELDVEAERGGGMEVCF